MGSGSSEASGGNRPRTNSSATSLLEEELLNAVRPVSAVSTNSSGGYSFPIASAVGRASISAVIGIASTLSTGAKVLKEAMEGGEANTDGTAAPQEAGPFDPADDSE